MLVRKLGRPMWAPNFFYEFKTVIYMCQYFPSTEVPCSYTMKQAFMISVFQRKELVSQREVRELLDNSSNDFQKPKIDFYIEKPRVTFYNGKCNVLNDFCYTE